MKGIVVDCKTGKTEAVDNGQPFPQLPSPAELIKINLADLKKLIDYAEAQKWI